MGNKSTSTGDRAVDVYHLLKSTEKWHGFVLTVPDPRNAAGIKHDLDKILEGEGYNPAITKEDKIYFSGTFNPDILKVIKAEIKNKKQMYASNPVYMGGSYFDFLGDYWVDEALEKANSRQKH